jgi:hypothetical protein
VTASAGNVNITAGTQTTESINAVNGKFTMTAGTLKHPATGSGAGAAIKRLNITVNDFELSGTGIIDVTGLGYYASYSYINGDVQNTGIGSTNSTYYGGGSHGGRGGSTSQGNYSGQTFDNYRAPNFPGGGNTAGYYGGGVVKVTSTTGCKIDGASPLIKANGGTGSAGGSIYLKCQSFTGNPLTSGGVILASGGVGSGNISAGGGGRIALETTGSDTSWNQTFAFPASTAALTTFKGMVKTFGGKKDAANAYTGSGGAGTIFLKHSGLNYGLMIVNNDSTISASESYLGYTYLPSFTGTWTSVNGLTLTSSSALGSPAANYTNIYKGLYLRPAISAAFNNGTIDNYGDDHLLQIASHTDTILTVAADADSIITSSLNGETFRSIDIFDYLDVDGKASLQSAGDVVVMDTASSISSPITMTDVTLNIADMNARRGVTIAGASNINFTSIRSSENIDVTGTTSLTGPNGSGRMYSAKTITINTTGTVQSTFVDANNFTLTKGTFISEAMNITALLKIDGGTLKHPVSTASALKKLTITAGSFQQNGGAINLIGLGYPATYSFGPTGTPSLVLGSTVYGGGTHGGKGGAGNGGVVGYVFDDYRNPSLPGGGSGAQGISNYGGGVLRLTATLGNCALNSGTINANGAASAAGGTVYMKCQSFSGAFAGLGISANGGDAYNTNYGAGGGGRIALISTNDKSSTNWKDSFLFPVDSTSLANFKSHIQAKGGTTTNAYGSGGAGTIFLQSGDLYNGAMIIDNGSITTNANSGLTVLPGVQGTVTALDAADATSKTLTTTLTSTPAYTTDYNDLLVGSYIRPDTSTDYGVANDLTDDNPLRITSHVAGTKFVVHTAWAGFATLPKSFRTLHLFDYLEISANSTVDSVGDVYFARTFTTSTAPFSLTNGFLGFQGAALSYPLFDSVTLNTGTYPAGSSILKAGSISISTTGSVVAGSLITTSGAFSIQNATVNAPTITSATTLTLQSANVTSTTVTSTGDISATSTAVNATTMNSGGALSLSSSSSITGTTVTSTGNLSVATTSTLSATTINSGGTTTVTSGTLGNSSSTITSTGALSLSSPGIINAATLNAQSTGSITGGSCVIATYNGQSGLTISGSTAPHLSFENINLGSNSLSFTGGTMLHPASVAGAAPKKLNINASSGSVTINGGTIDVTGLGYPAGYSYGSTTSTTPLTSTGRFGGSYGGQGGNGSTGVVGLTYGNLRAPTFPGGGSVAAAGGGVVIITTSSLTVGATGSIKADGAASAVTTGGGGAGGSIYLNLGAIAGAAANGAISAKGGAGSAANIGGGGGGRISIVTSGDSTYWSNNFVYPSTASNLTTIKSVLTVVGGNFTSGTAGPGGSGTIYLKNSSQNYGYLILNNENRSFTYAGMTLLPSLSGTTLSSSAGSVLNITASSMTLNATNHANIFTGMRVIPDVSFNNGTASDFTDDFANILEVQSNTDTALTMTSSVGSYATNKTFRSLDMFDHIDVSGNAYLYSYGNVAITNGLPSGAGNISFNNAKFYSYDFFSQKPMTLSTVPTFALTGDFKMNKNLTTSSVTNFSMASFSVIGDVSMTSTGNSITNFNTTGNVTMLTAPTQTITNMNVTGNVSISEAAATTLTSTAMNITGDLSLIGAATTSITNVSNITLSGGSKAFTLNGGTLTHPASTGSTTNKLTLNVGSFTFQSGIIDVSSKGYPASYYGYAPTSTPTTTLGAYTTASSNTFYGGGSHGGTGGDPYCTDWSNTCVINPGYNLYGPTYDDYRNPVLPGGSGPSYNGGGVVLLTASGACTINTGASINANGGISSAGGSINLSCSSIGGTAAASAITANGGDGQGSHFGAGGGGRIAIVTTGTNGSSDWAGSFMFPTSSYLTNFKAMVKAYGGAYNAANNTDGAGGAGTIYLKHSGLTYGALLIDNGSTVVWNASMGKTPLLSFAGTITGVTAASKTITLDTASKISAPKRNTATTPVFSVNYNNWIKGVQLRPDVNLVDGTPTVWSDDQILTVTANTSNVLTVAEDISAYSLVSKTYRSIDILDYLEVGSNTFIETYGDVYIKTGSLANPSVGIVLNNSFIDFKTTGSGMSKYGSNLTLNNANLTFGNGTGGSYSFDSVSVQNGTLNLVSLYTGTYTQSGGASTLPTLSSSNTIAVSGGTLSSTTASAVNNVTITGGTSSGTTLSSSAGSISVSAGTVSYANLTGYIDVLISGGTVNSCTNITATTGALTINGSPTSVACVNIIANAGAVTVGGAAAISSCTNLKALNNTISIGSTGNVSAINIVANGNFTKSATGNITCTNLSSTTGSVALNAGAAITCNTAITGQTDLTVDGTTNTSTVVRTPTLTSNGTMNIKFGTTKVTTINATSGVFTMSNGILQQWSATTTGAIYKLTLNVNSFNLTGGTINVSSQGYPAGYSYGSTGPATYLAATSNGSFYAGASHGGSGGLSSNAVPVAGPTYDNYKDPSLPGAGTPAGTIGGGVVIVNSSGICTINTGGTITANGGNGSAGGSIKMSCSGMAGTAGGAAITANGGNSPASGTGAGGGGRIAIITTGNSASWGGNFAYPTNTASVDAFKNVVRARGGSGDTTDGDGGGAGTVYLKHSGLTYGDLIVDNTGVSNFPGGSITPTSMLNITTTTSVTQSAGNVFKDLAYAISNTNNQITLETAANTPLLYKENLFVGALLHVFIRPSSASARSPLDLSHMEATITSNSNKIVTTNYSGSYPNFASPGATWASNTNQYFVRVVYKLDHFHVGNNVDVNFGDADLAIMATSGTCDLRTGTAGSMSVGSNSQAAVFSIGSAFCTKSGLSSQISVSGQGVNGFL